MRTTNIQKPGRSFILIVFLVLALGLIAALSYFSHKNSDELTQTVKNLRNNRYEIDRIDQAIQLLYKAENNSRAYMLTWDPRYQESYMEQLTQVSTLVDSIKGSSPEDLGELLEDKRHKTEVFILARQLADSLLKLNAPANQVSPEAISPPVAEKKMDQAPPKTEPRVVDEVVVTEKNKKGLFGRIAAAIANKPREKTIQKVTVYENPVVEREIPDEPEPQAASSGESAALNPAFNNLSEKEKQLLEANGRLFSQLQSVLVQLKLDEQDMFNRRQRKLSDNASQVINRLRNNHNYILILSIVLTGIILIVLGKLFKNHKDLQKARLQAEAHARYKSEFVALLSHEIRTPLQSIHAYSSELTPEQTKEEQTQVIDAIKLSAHTLMSIINNILDFSKIEQGKFKLNHAPFIPATLIQEVRSGLGIQAKQKNLHLKSEISESANQALYGDAFYLRQLLINLVSNAIKYTRKGHITIKADFILQDAIKGNLHLEVRDTGIGIAKDKIPTLFEAYNSQDHNREIPEGSTGLGLSVVKKIIDFHRGTWHVESEPGLGTVFFLTLPYDIYLSAPEAEPEQALEVEGVRKLLINENDKLTSRYLSLLFGDKNYVLTVTRNGEEAFKTLIENEFDLIITDIAMPGMSGYELLEKIRGLSDSYKSNVPVIALTGFEPPEEDTSSEKPAFDAWIMKPFNADLLIQRVEELCRLSHRKQEEERNDLS